MNQPMALGINTEQPNTLGSFAEGQMSAAKMQRAKMEEAAGMMEMFGAAGMYALNGDIDGEVDPAKYNEVLDTFEAQGLDMSAYRDKPHFAKVAVTASVSALERLKMARDDRDFAFTMEKWKAELENADRDYGLEQEKLGIMRDKNNRAPVGYEFGEDGSLAPIRGGPADPTNPLNTKKITGPALSPTAQKELFEADESVSSGEAVVTALDHAIEINDEAYSGPLAETRGYGGSLIGLEAGEKTEELRNLITTQALDQLKATFGSMPTEGERKVLLEVQGSVNQAPAVRKKIYERAKEMAARRIEFNRQKAARLRSGEYFSEGPGSPSGDVIEIPDDRFDVQED